MKEISDWHQLDIQHLHFRNIMFLWYQGHRFVILFLDVPFYIHHSTKGGSVQIANWIMAALSVRCSHVDAGSQYPKRSCDTGAIFVLLTVLVTADFYWPMLWQVAPPTHQVALEFSWPFLALEFYSSKTWWANIAWDQSVSANLSFDNCLGRLDGTAARFNSSWPSVYG